MYEDHRRLRLVLDCRHHQRTEVCVPVDNPVPPDFACLPGGAGVGATVSTPGCSCTVPTADFVSYARREAAQREWGHWRQVSRQLGLVQPAVVMRVG